MVHCAKRFACVRVSVVPAHEELSARLGRIETLTFVGLTGSLNVMMIDAFNAMPTAPSPGVVEVMKAVAGVGSPAAPGSPKAELADRSLPATEAAPASVTGTAPMSRSATTMTRHATNRALPSSTGSSVPSWDCGVFGECGTQL